MKFLEQTLWCHHKIQQVTNKVNRKKRIHIATSEQENYVLVFPVQCSVLFCMKIGIYVNIVSVRSKENVSLEIIEPLNFEQNHSPV